MAQSVIIDASRDIRTRPATSAVVPELTVRVVGALLALAIAAVHVADQGGVTQLASPDWQGWGYRLIEVGGVLTAVALLAPGTSWLGWRAAALLGTGPFVGYLMARTVGVPGNSDDIGNWGDWVGTVSLVVEAALVILACGFVLPAWQQRRQGRTQPALQRL